MSVNKASVTVKNMELDVVYIKEYYLTGNVSNQTFVGNVSPAGY
jgi:hypothetical protein